MPVSRIRLRINAASNSVPAGDSGVLYGSIQQMRWVPTLGDTGADLNVTLCPLASGGDTAGGITVYDDNDCLGTAFTRVPVQPAQTADGFDTGVDGYCLFVGARDRIRAKVSPGGNAAVSGDLYIWQYSGD